MEQRILNNKYILNSIVGTGGMAIVYKGISMDSGETVAIKMLRPEYLDDQNFVRRFKKEASIARSIFHKNIVNMKYMGDDNGSPYIVMEYVQGRTLKDYIQEHGVLDHEETVGIAIQVAEALKYAHSKKLVHRDIKPQNILLGTDGVVKVGDFGIAKIATSSTVTMSGSNVMGSVHYMSPEQARGGMVDRKADFYSLGIVMYEMLTGTVPFKGDTPVAVAIKHLQENIVSPRMRNPQVSVALDEIIMKLTAKQKDERYHSAEEVIDDLILALKYPNGGFVKISHDQMMDSTRKVPVITPEMLERFGPVETDDPITAPQNGDKKHVQHRRDHKHAAFSIARLMLVLVLLAAVLFSMGLIARSLFSNNRIEVKGTVPQLQGLSDEIAADTIFDSGFKYELTYEHHTKVPEGVVIRQNPAPGTEMDKGEKIFITISLGAEKGIVPNVKMYEFNQAVKMIEDAGFSVGDVQQIVSESPKDYVVRQEPESDMQMPLGEKVHIWIAIPPESAIITLPDLVALNREQAEEQLQSLNVQGITVNIEEVNSGYEAGIVVNQDPQAGTILEDGMVITLYTSNGQGEGYSIEKEILLSVEQNNTKVRIVYVDGAINKTVYEQVLSKGDHNVTLVLTSGTPGEKGIVIYYNDAIHANDRITFGVNN